MKETRAIAGYEGLYAITNDGHVWASERHWIAGKGIPRSLKAGWLIAKPNDDGYPQVKLNRLGKRRTVKVHRLVALTWIGPPPTAHHQINHKNGIKTDARATNLEWVTASENRLHAFRIGLIKHTPAFFKSVRKNLAKAHEANRNRKIP